MVRIHGKYSAKLTRVYQKLVDLGLNFVGELDVYITECEAFEGLFVVPHGNPVIHLCNNKYLIENFIHELVHFEQLCNGKKLSERGLAVFPQPKKKPENP